MVSKNTSTTESSTDKNSLKKVGLLNLRLLALRDDDVLKASARKLPHNRTGSSGTFLVADFVVSNDLILSNSGTGGIV